MPTKKRRVGFIPREDVMKIIDKLSLENNLSNSKIISILVEEALSIRGLLNNKTGKATNLFQKRENLLKSSSKDSNDFNIKEKLIVNSNLENCKVSGKANLLEQANKETFDLQTYKKFLSFLKFQEMLDKYNS